LEALTKLAYFLVYLKQENPNMIYGSHSIDDVWASFTALFAPHLTPEQLEAKLLSVNITN
jgi:hypothetical protein